MKRMAAVLMIAMVLLPGVALAGSSTDAALGLGAFAVFNQILSGTGVFGVFGRPVAAPQPVVVQQPVIVQQPVVVAPPVYVPPAVVYAPAPPVYVTPAPVVVYSAPGRGYYQHYGHYQHYGRARHDDRHHR